MITNICLNNVSSYKVASLDTDKKINLIYGLNGTGKSTFSNFLYDRTDQDFSGCHINGLKDEEIIVYNQKFIKENFFEAEGLKGIFTLSKDNQIAAQKINDATSEIKRLEQEKIIKDIELEQIKNAINSKLESAELKTWEIKTNYYGGDRVLEFCLRGYVGSKSALFNHIKSLTKPNTQPSKTIETIKEEVQAIAGENSQKYDELPKIKFEMQNIENDHLFLKQIIGNESSSVASLINKLSNSDWIKDGLKYLPDEIFNKNEQCPFCQEHTISGLLLERIKEYFDESYESDLRQLKIFLISYKMASDLIIEKSDFDANSKIMTYRKDFEIKYNNFTRVLSNNLVLIENKIKSPSMLVSLESSNNSLEELNDLISTINKTIVEHNRKIDLKSQSLEELKKEFLALMRWDYDQTISTFAAEKNLSDKAVNASEVIVENLKTAIFNQNSIIIEQQKQTVNIQEAITSINSSLIDLGVDDFHIKHHSGNLYNICRGENNQKIFHSLSEGEKMIISFLYFMELCRGKKDPNDTGSKKIIVIDDPISSLSHIHIFNIGRLIRNEFFGSKITKNGNSTWHYKYEQIFLLTHSLYFFYEMTETNHETRKEKQNLFRLNKNDSGSKFTKLKYENIQNDYHAYWYIIKDADQQPALIANCMRNIIEYFFNFVEKSDLNNTFSHESLQSIRFRAFNRYINRESHSLGQNIFDMKEFNYEDFKAAFELLFEITGYQAHYKKMIRI